MDTHASTPFDTAPDSTADPAAWGRGLLRRQAMMLEQLAEAGLRLAQAVERGVTEADESPVAGMPPADAAMAFSRVARAVRMTALLQTA